MLYIPKIYEYLTLDLGKCVPLTVTARSTLPGMYKVCVASSGHSCSDAFDFYKNNIYRILI
jgi:hypothetical protein